MVADCYVGSEAAVSLSSQKDKLKMFKGALWAIRREAVRSHMRADRLENLFSRIQSSIAPRSKIDERQAYKADMLHHMQLHKS